MRSFVLRGSTTLFVLLALYGGGLLIGKTSGARQRGEEYPLSRLPRDMVTTIVDLVESMRPDESVDTGETARDRAPDPGPAQAGSAPSPDRPPSELERGRSLFDAGEFRGAIRQWEFAARSNLTQALDDDLARARLFAVVVERFPTAAERRHEAKTTLMLKSGETMEGRIKEEDEKEVTIVFSNGSSGVIPRSAIADRIDPDVDRTREDLESDYKSRAAVIHEPFGPAYLDLAKWCVGRDLTGHLAYLLERVRASEADEPSVISRLLLRAYARGSSWEKDEIARVLDRCYPHDSEVRQLMRRRLGVAAREPARDDRPLAGAGTSPTHVARPTREGLTEEFLTRVDQAKAFAREGRKHYEKAMPDMPDRAAHREKALENLTKARDLYDTLLDDRDEAWLRSRLQSVYKMLYWLRKDQPVK